MSTADFRGLHYPANHAIWPKTRFHGDNTGSNPVGDAKN